MTRCDLEGFSERQTFGGVNITEGDAMKGTNTTVTVSSFPRRVRVEIISMCKFGGYSGTLQRVDSGPRPGIQYMSVFFFNFLAGLLSHLITNGRGWQRSARKFCEPPARNRSTLEGYDMSRRKLALHNSCEAQAPCSGI